MFAYKILRVSLFRRPIVIHTFFMSVICIFANVLKLYGHRLFVFFMFTYSKFQIFEIFFVTQTFNAFLFLFMYMPFFFIRFCQ